MWANLDFGSKYPYLKRKNIIRFELFLTFTANHIHSHAKPPSPLFSRDFGVFNFTFSHKWKHPKTHLNNAHCGQKMGNHPRRTPFSMVACRWSQSRSYFGTGRPHRVQTYACGQRSRVHLARMRALQVQVSIGPSQRLTPSAS